MRGLQGGFGLTMILLATGAASLYASAPPCTTAATVGFAAMVLLAIGIGYRDLRRSIVDRWVASAG